MAAQPGSRAYDCPVFASTLYRLGVSKILRVASADHKSSAINATEKFFEGMMFKVTHKDKTTQARIGLLVTAHGEINTPVFMPVGTQGTVKALSNDDLKDCDVEIVLGNAYHLYLRPGIEIIKKGGGLHDFMGWQGPILTDSGG